MISFAKEGKPYKHLISCCSKNFLSLLKMAERRKGTSENPYITVKPVHLVCGWTCPFSSFWRTDIWVSLHTYVCLQYSWVNYDFVLGNQEQRMHVPAPLSQWEHCYCGEMNLLFHNIRSHLESRVKVTFT